MSGEANRPAGAAGRNERHELRLMTLLQRLVRERTLKGAARTLGLDPRTVQSSLEAAMPEEERGLTLPPEKTPLCGPERRATAIAGLASATPEAVGVGLVTLLASLAVGTYAHGLGREDGG